MSGIATLLCNHAAPAVRFLYPVFVLSWHLEVVNFKLLISTDLSLLLNYSKNATLCDLVLSLNNSRVRPESDWISKIKLSHQNCSGKKKKMGFLLGNGVISFLLCDIDVCLCYLW